MLLTRKRIEAKTRLSHALAAVVIAIEAFARWEEREWPAAAVMTAVAIFLAVFAALHPRLHRTPFVRHLNTGVFLGEAAVMAVIAAGYFHRGKHALPWCYAGVTIAYLLLAVRQHNIGRGGPREGVATPAAHI